MGLTGWITALVLWWGSGLLMSADAVRPGGELDLFDERRPVMRLQIRISPEGVAQLSEFPREYVRAAIREGGAVWTNVAVRLKGNEGGSFRPITGKPAMTINFDKFVKRQLFHGNDKVYLNNSVEDGSYMTEVICGELFRAAGVPAPWVTHAMVELNGRPLGLYVVKEGFNKGFLRRALNSDDGNFYDGGRVTDVDEPLQLSSGDGPVDHSDLRALVEAAREPLGERRWARLRGELDLDEFMRFMAMEVLTGHWDGYSINRNNYRVYRHPGRGFIFMPHGMDLMFSEPGTPPEPYMDGLVARAVIETAAGRRQYWRTLMTLRDRVFRVEGLTNRVHELRARLRPVLAGESLDAALRHDAAVELLLSKIEERARTVAAWPSGLEPEKSVLDEFDRVRVVDWRPRDETKETVFIRRDGFLEIAATAHDQARPSWRSSVFLPPGRYVFVGRARTENVRARAAAPGDGAGIRVAGGADTRDGIFGDSEWRELRYPFVVERGSALEEVELICELRATEGRVWFDSASLMVLKVADGAESDAAAGR